MDWKTPYTGGNKIETAVGSPKRPIFKAELGKNGELVLIEDGYEDIYAQIQSFKESVDINTIVARYAAGDVYALQQRVGSYGDFISVPSSYMDVLNGAIELKRTYELNCAENADFRKSYPTLDDFVSNFNVVNKNNSVPKIDIESEVGQSEQKSE